MKDYYTGSLGSAHSPGLQVTIDNETTRDNDTSDAFLQQGGRGDYKGIADTLGQ